MKTTLEFKTVKEFAAFLLSANLTEFDLARQKLMSVSVVDTPVISFWNSLSKIIINTQKRKIYSVERVRSQGLLVAYKIVNHLSDEESIKENLIRIEGLKKDVSGCKEVKKIISKNLPDSFLLSLGSKICSHDYVFRKII